MTVTFLHGVEVDELPTLPAPVPFNNYGAVGLVGTAANADAAIFPLNQPVLLNSNPTQAAKLGSSGTLLTAVQQIYAEGGSLVVVVRVDDNTDPAQVMTNIIGSQASKTGLWALLAARAELGVIPKTLIFPGYTQIHPVVSGALTANPVVTAAIPLAQRLRARIYMDLPATSDAAALAARELYTSDRIVGFYPQVEVWDSATSAYISAPASSSMAGLTARVIQNLGFWFSPSNQPLQGVGGVSTPIDWAMSDPNCEANLLNATQITTIVNLAQGGEIAYGGFRRWGNRNFSGADSAFAFESVRTALDAIYDVLDTTTLWALDKPPSLQLLQDMTQLVNDFFKLGKRQGWLVGGKCWLDPSLNPSAQTSQGIWTWSIDPEPPAPMEHIIYQSSPNAAYYDAEVAALANMISYSG